MDNKSLSSLVLELMSLSNTIIFALQGKSVRVIAVVLFCFLTFEMVFSAGIVQFIGWSDTIVSSFSFNSLDCISGLVLLCFFISSSRFLLRPYNATTTSNLLFVHSFMQFQLKCVRDVIFRS